MMRKLFTTAILLLLSLTVAVSATAAICDLPFAQIKKLIINSSKERWTATTGQRCVCPGDRNQFDRACGLNSAWANRTSEEPKCYTTDVDINDLRQYCPGIHNSARWDQYLSTSCCANHGGYCGCGGSFKASFGICCDGTLATHCNDCFTFGERFRAD